MELLSTPFFTKYAALAFAIAFLVEALKKAPYVDEFFYHKKAGQLVLVLLPYMLGVAGGVCLYSMGLVPEFLVGGICAGGLSSLAYDVFNKARNKDA